MANLKLSCSGQVPDHDYETGHFFTKLITDSASTLSGDWQDLTKAKRAELRS